MKKIIIKNKNNSIYQIVSPIVAKYIKDNSDYFDSVHNDWNKIANGVAIKEYATKRDKLRFKPIIISFVTDGFKNDSMFKIRISSNDGEYQKDILTSKKKVYLYNLIPNKTYKCQIFSLDDKTKSDPINFSIKDKYRFIYSPNCYNVRDIGGKEVEGGKIVKYGLVYRGAELTTKTYKVFNPYSQKIDEHIRVLKKSDFPYFYELGFKVDLDFRGDFESNYAQESPLNSNSHPLDYYRCSFGAYRDFFLDLDKNKEIYKKIFELFSNANKKPIYLHCWGGADRTGTICFILEAILGCYLKDMVIDFELTCFDRNRITVKPFDPNYNFAYHKNSNFYMMVEYINDIKKDDETIQQFFTRFLIEQVGVSPATIDKIKKIFLI